MSPAVTLTKRQILEKWGLSDEAYKSIRIDILRDRKMASGVSSKLGGIRVRGTNSSTELAKEEEKIPLDGFRKEAVKRLSELFKYEELENLLSKEILFAIREHRKISEGNERRGTKVELATAIVLGKDRDLFCDVGIRIAVAKACKIPLNERFVPGKQGALEFVGKAGFPLEFAGLPAPDRPNDYELLKGFTQMGVLQDFQKEILGAIKTILTYDLSKAPEMNRALVSLPTGAGKTRVAVEALREWLIESRESKIMIWMAHTEELCEQAIACFRQVWEQASAAPSLHLIRFWGDFSRDYAKDETFLGVVNSAHTVLVSTPQRLNNMFKTAREHNSFEELASNIDFLLIDEAHRAGAPTYMAIIEELQKRNEDLRTIGLTATPFRLGENGADDLAAVFNRTLLQPYASLGFDPKQKLKDRSILANEVEEWIEIEHKRPISKSSLDQLFEGYKKTAESKGVDMALSELVDTMARRLKVMKSVVSIAKNPENKVLYFGPTVKDAEMMTLLLRHEGIKASFVSGETKDPTRRLIINDFKAGNLQVLCNCEVLTTGFDAPKISHVVVARPTISPVLYEQMIGRGLRGPKFGGTSTCTILNCDDNFNGEKIPIKLGYELYREYWKNLKVAA